MPYVEVKIAGALSKDQKTKIADGISQLLLDIVDKPKQATYVVFEEVSRDNWAKGGELLSDISG